MQNATPPAQTLEIIDTPQTLARALRTTPQTIGNWQRAGIIPAIIAVGRIIRFDRAAVLEALAAASTNGRASAQ